MIQTLKIKNSIFFLRENVKQKCFQRTKKRNFFLLSFRKFFKFAKRKKTGSGFTKKAKFFIILEFRRFVTRNFLLKRTGSVFFMRYSGYFKIKKLREFFRWKRKKSAFPFDFKWDQATYSWFTSPMFKDWRSLRQ